MRREFSNSLAAVSVFSGEGPPVPIPNTVVKLISAEDTWWETARENRSMPTQRLLALCRKPFLYYLEVYVIYYRYG